MFGGSDGGATWRTWTSKPGLRALTALGAISALALVVGLFVAAPADAHSGGLDNYGCHGGSQPYHCHNGSTSPTTTQAPTTTTAPPIPATYDANGGSGTIYRLYRAYFLREPDKSGYDYWFGVYRQGYPLDYISNDFARSDEFQYRYGSVDNADFLELVYINVLGRGSDADGYAYWMDQMNRGMSRGFVMIYFSDSAEFRAKTAAGRPPGY